jgi:hypothetical protein
MASKYIDIAVIVEPREHDNLKDVINNILENLKDVNVLIFHGNKNKQFILSELNDNIDKIKLINLNVNNLTVREYSDLLLTKNFWNQINYERILLFQTDSCICNYSDLILKDCQKYGFVGAPTRKYREYPYQNGGFSFRRNSAMIKALNTIKKDEKYFPEDRFFSLDKGRVVLSAHWDLANRFSVENYYNEKPFGQHKCWKYQSEENMKKLINNYPILNIFKKLKN